MLLLSKLAPPHKAVYEVNFDALRMQGTESVWPFESWFEILKENFWLRITVMTEKASVCRDNLQGTS